MAEVYSISTGARLDKQDFSKHEQLAKDGEYLGCIPPIEAEAMRQLQTRLVCEQAKIDELIAEFDLHYEEYLENVINVFLLLGADYTKYNGKDLLIGADGHVWLAKDNK